MTISSDFVSRPISKWHLQIRVRFTATVKLSRATNGIGKHYVCECGSFVTILFWLVCLRWILVVRKELKRTFTQLLCGFFLLKPSLITFSRKWPWSSKTKTHVWKFSISIRNQNWGFWVTIFWNLTKNLKQRLKLFIDAFDGSNKCTHEVMHGVVNEANSCIPFLSLFSIFMTNSIAIACKWETDFLFGMINVEKGVLIHGMLLQIVVFLFVQRSPHHIAFSTILSQSDRKHIDFFLHWEEEFPDNQAYFYLRRMNRPMRKAQRTNLARAK